MIKNQRQYRITKAQAAKFERALQELGGLKGRSPDVDPLWVELQEGALQSQVAELNGDLHEYEALQSGTSRVFSISSLVELPDALIKARIGASLSQAELAARLGLKEQQVQRYEANGYAGASLQRVQEVMNALGIELKENILVSPTAASLPRLLSRLKDVGINDSLLRKLMPKEWRHQDADEVEAEAQQPLALQIASVVSHIFHWSMEQLLGDLPLELPSQALVGVRYKLPSGRNELQTAAYTIYAHHLALLAIQCTPDLLPMPVPSDPDKVYNEIVTTHGVLSFDTVLRYIWDHGIVVLPLSDPGTFHGACWRLDGREAVVLKQRTRSAARWTIDALHELFHTTENPEAPQAEVIEAGDVLALGTTASDGEKAATDFALAVALPNADALAQRCAQRAKGKVEWLKQAAQQVATEQNVDPGLLANYLAHRLSQQGINWWGAATGLQTQIRDPLVVARELFFSNVQLRLLSPTDRDILEEALTNEQNDT